MAFTEVDNDFAAIVEEGAKRKMEFGGDARIKIGTNDSVGPAFYAVEPKDAVPGKLLKIWSGTATDKAKYEYTEGVTTAQADGLAWLTSAGGSLATMETFIPA